MKKIMFSDVFGLTQAVLDGRKTMTRRVISYSKNKAFLGLIDDDSYMNTTGALSYDEEDGVFRIDDAYACYTCRPLYKVGEVVAIAQSYKDLGYHAIGLDRSPKDYRIVRGTLGQSKGWNNKMFVRSEACKHHIRITNVKIERLQDISDEECRKEGIYEDSGDEEFPPSIFYEFEGNEDDGFDTPREAFAALIDKVSGKETWDSNPYVFAYGFQLID